MTSNSPSVGPLIEQTITVTPNIIYNVKIEVMLTDLDSSSEYADISINGNNVGRCNPVGIGYEAGSCRWYTCTISPTEATSTNSYLMIRLQYSPDVESVTPCTYDGQTWHAVARVTLTSG